ncbi:MAG: hypothetical protein AB8U91_01350 [Candidatus Midichloria sp.]
MVLVPTVVVLLVLVEVVLVVLVVAVEEKVSATTSPFHIQHILVPHYLCHLD